ncbi:beta-propeller fold lactonase family protein [Variovorax sp. dw_954]|uniref:beta-propeller fold lactonase family protein n=1 Tax=Variovorax sp. dw_954 TaxID=2720078 RepID=UPI001BD2CE79|nr:beta-propeller fold lactonase family protein [Variovorax sp. dw_954]
MKHLALATTICLAALAAAGASTTMAAEPVPSPAVTARWTFDGSIHNNSLALSPDERTAVVSYSERPEVIVFDLSTGKVRAVLHGFVTPRNIIFAPSGRQFYVSDSSLGTVAVIDTASLETVNRLPVGAGAFGTVLSKDGGTLYVNNQAANTVTRYDLAAQQPRAVVTGFAQPRQGVRLSPDGQALYVTNFLGDKITVVDTTTNRITGEITGFDKLRAISVAADGKTIFAANSGSNTIAVVDVDKRRIATTITVGRDPYGAALSPDGLFVYVGNLGDNTVSVISVATQQVVSTITGFKEPRQAIVFARDGMLAYVLNEDLSVSRVDRASNRIVGTLAAPAF